MSTAECSAPGCAPGCTGEAGCRIALDEAKQEIREYLAGLGAAVEADQWPLAEDDARRLLALVKEGRAEWRRVLGEVR